MINQWAPSRKQVAPAASTQGLPPRCHGQPSQVHTEPGQVGLARAVGDHPAVSAHEELRAIAERVSAHLLPAPAASRQPQVCGLDGPPRAVGAGQQHARHLSRPAWL